MSTEIDVTQQISSFLNQDTSDRGERVYRADISEADVGKIFADPLGLLVAAGIPFADGDTILVTSILAQSVSVAKLGNKDRRKFRITVTYDHETGTITISIAWR